MSPKEKKPEPKAKPPTPPKSSKETKDGPKGKCEAKPSTAPVPKAKPPVQLPAPVKVSPLIKAGRWSFLVLGVFYGLFHQRRLSKKEAKIRKKEAEEKVIRDAQLAIEKKKYEEIERQAIEVLSGAKH